MHYVIGSGPAGLACAAALLGRGVQVTMLDAGLRLEPDREALRAGMAGKMRSEWNLWESELALPVSEAKRVPYKLNYGSDYAYRRPGLATPVLDDGAGLRGSYAQGGFSNVWGGAVLPYRERDLAGWPIGLAALEPGYRAAIGMLPLAAVRDGLEVEFPLYGELGAAMQPCCQARNLLAAMEAGQAALRGRGVRFGAARLAVAAQDCISCGACLNGCPRDLIFSSRQQLDALCAQGMEYISGLVVKTVEENADGVKILALDAAGGRHKFTGARAFLAAGALNSTEIMLRSLGESSAVLKDSQYFLFPMLQAKASKNVEREALHTLAQVFLEIDDPALSAYGVHVQLYGYSDVLSATLRQKLGRFARFFPTGALLDRMMIAQGYLHSAHSGRIEVRLEGERLLVKSVRHPQVDARVKQVLGKLRKVSRLTKAWPVAALLEITEPGRGFHSGGSFPMAEAPGPWESDTLGRVRGMQRVHLVDASVFPSIPVPTITLTAMANAWRIGDAAGELK
jgi:choline dehydrogenase-like flavoprotein